MEEIISLKNISYSYYGKIEALKDVNLSIGQGEMLAVIGINGSGKSTLLHLVNALIHADKGEYRFKGTIVTDKSMKSAVFGPVFRKSMGYIFQNPDVQLFCPTVFDELMFGPLQLNMPYANACERAEETLDFLGISHLKERSVLMLSGGEKKKVAIASVLTTNPDILLFDEPLSSLDPATQMYVIDLIEELGKTGKTIIFTTHQLDLVEYLQPRVAIMSADHTLKKTGPSSEIVRDLQLLAEAGLYNERIKKIL